MQLKEIPGHVKMFTPPNKFIKLGEAIGYLEQILPNTKDSLEPLPWTIPETGPRSAFQLYAKFGIVRIDHSSPVSNFGPVTLDSKFSVPEDAPEDIKEIIKNYQSRCAVIPAKQEKLNLLVSELSSYNHILNREQKVAEANSDTNLAQTRFKEAKALLDFAKNELLSLEEEARDLSDKYKWEEGLKEGASMMVRFQELDKILKLKNAPPKELLEEEREKAMMAFAEASRESETLIEQGKDNGSFSPNNINLKLYLYYHPNTMPTTKYSPI